MDGKMNFEKVPLRDLIARGIVSPENSKQPDGDSQPNVIVVDDERIIADTLSTILNHNGYSATATYDAKSALELMNTTSPDLVITDVLMPEMNGVDLAIEVRNRVPDCEVILFTGQPQNSEVLRPALDPKNGFSLLVKPLHPSLLLRTISEVLGSA